MDQLLLLSLWTENWRLARSLVSAVAVVVAVELVTVVVVVVAVAAADAVMAAAVVAPVYGFVVDY